MKKRTFIILIAFATSYFSNCLAQNNHFGIPFGRTDNKFLWGVSGGVTMPNISPSTSFQYISLRQGFDFGLDFRHKLGNMYDGTYFVFLHYGFNMGSFYYKVTDNTSIIPTECTLDHLFYENNPRFLHLDIPIGIEFPLGYICHNRLSFNFRTTITSRFYFFPPNQTYNLATTNGLAIRFDKIQLEAAYSFFLLSQFSKKIYMEMPIWKTRELYVGLRFYF